MKTCHLCKYTMEKDKELIESRIDESKKYHYWECSGCGLTLLFRDKK